MRILGIDPALRNCGWGVIDHDGRHLRYIASGVIRPPTSASIEKRLEHLHTDLHGIINLYKPEQCAIEESFVSANGQSTLKLGLARGALLLSLGLSQTPVSEYAARLIKKTVTGNGRADKDQMQQMVRLLLPQSNTQSADEADALAIAICHAHHAPALT